MPRDQRGRLRWWWFPTLAEWAEIADTHEDEHVRQMARRVVFEGICPELITFHYAYDHDANAQRRKFIAEEILGIPDLGIDTYLAIGWVKVLYLDPSNFHHCD